MGWGWGVYQGEVSGLMAPTGAYLDFVLDVIPYSQHHDPEHGLGEIKEVAEQVTHVHTR